MTAILICPADRSGMSLLAGKRPLALVPVLGRSLLDLALAYLAARGFSRVRVLAADRPEMVRASVGRGETWGLQVEVTPETRESSVAEAGRKYPDVEASHIQVLDHLPGHPNLRLFDSPRDWMLTLGAALSQVTPERVGMQESPSGVWVERGAQIGRNVKLIAPCWIGAHVWVGAGTTLGPRAVIEAGCYVEHEVEVTESMIGPDTYVGAYTEVRRSLAWGSRLQNWENGSTTTVPDRFLLDDLTEGAHGSPGPGLPARAAALVALMLTAPLVVLAWIRHRRADGPLLRTKQAVQAPLPADGRTVVITYRELAGMQGIGRRWPELWEIVRGRFTWVGNRPLSPEQAATLRDDFERLWLSVPSGLISLAELEGWGDPMDIQTRVHSSFYAARHDWRDDLGLVARFLRHPFRIAAPVRSSIPQAP